MNKKTVAMFRLLAITAAVGSATAYGQSPANQAAGTSNPSINNPSINNNADAAAQDVSTPVVSVMDEGSESGWVLFLDQLQDVAKASPELMAEAARVDAERENYAAEKGDLGLDLSITHTRYPESTGTSVGSGGSFTSLDQYSEARLSLDLMHILARRSSKVDSAEAKLDSQEYTFQLKSIEATVRLMEDAVTAWSYRYRREALDNALNSIEGASRKLKISEKAGMPEITKATPTKVAEAIILHSEIKNSRDAISPLIPQIPNLPNDFAVLPLVPPSGDDVFKLATQDLSAKVMQAESRAYRELSESLRGNGVQLSVFAGIVEQKTNRPGGLDTEDGPLYGAQLNIPLGTYDSHRRRAAEYQAHAANLGALAAVRQSQRSLVNLRDRWAESVARLNQAQELMRQQAALLSKLRRRASSPNSGSAPEPWEVEMQEAVFWNAVAEVWQRRSAWVKDTLAWALLDPDYLHKHARNADPEGSQSLCAPFGSCADIAGL